MVQHMTEELGQLGVPLFCGGVYQGAIGEVELNSMRGKVVELLEVLVEDE